MCLILKFCYLVLLIFFQESFAMKETLHKKNLQLVENLKQDLRRNNDDYAELRRSFSITNNTQQLIDNNINLNDIRYKIITTRNDIKVTHSQSNKTYTTTITGRAYHKTRSNDDITNDNEDVRIKIIDNIKRRVDRALVSKEEVNGIDTNPQRRTDVNKDKKANDRDRTSDIDNRPRLKPLKTDTYSLLQKNNDRINRYRIKLLSNKTNQVPQIFTSTTRTPSLKKIKKHEKKNKMEKFKKFIQKNKGLLREFISSKKQMASKSPVTFATQHTTLKKQSQIVEGRGLRNIMRQAPNSLSNKMNLEELPNAAMLDMYPAKGGRIHSKRVKGHLCHRHVLIPEGPKYSSLGRIYLPPHAAAGIAHEYNATDIPKLLLPRCCNCCRKSVLGCE